MPFLRRPNFAINRGGVGEGFWVHSTGHGALWQSHWALKQGLLRGGKMASLPSSSQPPRLQYHLLSLTCSLLL